MKAVLDTNVVVSALLAPGGPCGRILDLLMADEFVSCVDPRILAEYESVLRRSKFRLPPERVEKVLNTIDTDSEHVTARPLGIPLADPDDVCFLEVAASAEAVLVTGNTRHFPSRVCRGVQVVDPVGFLGILAAARAPEP